MRFRARECERAGGRAAAAAARGAANGRFGDELG